MSWTGLRSESTAGDARSGGLGTVHDADAITGLQGACPWFRRDPAAGEETDTRRGSSTVTWVPTPGVDTTWMRPSCMSTMDFDDRQAQAGAAAALARAGAAPEPLEDVRQLVGGDAHARVRDREPGAVRRAAAAPRRRSPPAGVNLMALPMRLVSTWPMRGGSCGWRTGSGGRCSASVDALAPGDRLRLLEGALDHAAQVLRRAGPARPGPSRAWTAPAGWWPATPCARSGGRSAPGTRRASRGPPRRRRAAAR